MTLKQLLQLTAWDMEKPEPYGAFHLFFFLCGLVAVTLSAYLLRRSNERQNRIILLSVGIFLLLSEIYKQLFYYYVIGEGNYQWWIFPFQLCSVPIYLCTTAPFVKSEKVKSGIYNFMLSFNMMGGFVAFLEPSGLVHEYWTLTIHAFVWHLLLIFVGLYLGLSGRAGHTIRDYYHSVLLFLDLCGVAFVINLLFWDVSRGTINMFYVGPSISPIIIFEDIAMKFGWYVNTPIYMACLCLGALLFFLPFWRCNQCKKLKIRK